MMLISLMDGIGSIFSGGIGSVMVAIGVDVIDACGGVGKRVVGSLMDEIGSMVAGGRGSVM